MGEQDFAGLIHQEQSVLNFFRTYVKDMEQKIADENISVSDTRKVITEFLGIAEELLPFIREKYIRETDWNPQELIKSDAFRQLLSSLEGTNEVFLQNYNKELRRCSCCGQEVYFYPLSQYYHEMRKTYQVPEWLRGECGNEEEYCCPVCGCFDRDRLLLLFFQQMVPKDRTFRLLQVAPSRAIEQYLLNNYQGMQYESCDLFMPNVTFQANIEDMQMVADETYDILICIDVLEHVSDDRKAVAEFSRILKKDGVALIISPVCLTIDQTDQDLECSVEERWRRFGQDDHVRLYSKNGFQEVLRSAGFTLEMLSQDFFGEKLYTENGLLPTSTLYVLHK